MERWWNDTDRGIVLLFVLLYLLFIEVSLLLYFCDLFLYTIDYSYCVGLLNVFLKLILCVVPCVSGFIEYCYLFLFPNFKGVNGLCWLLFH